MKFAKQLNNEAVAEWRSQYFDYKEGKKKVAAVAKAIRSAERPKPSTPGSSLLDGPVFSLLRPRHDGVSPSGEFLRHVRTHSDSQAPTKPIPANESSLLQARQPAHLERPYDRQRMTSYGSIIGSPPHSPVVQQKGPPSSLELPAAAVIDRALDDNVISTDAEAPTAMDTQLAHIGSAYEIGTPTDLPSRKRTNSIPRGPFRRMLSMAGASVMRRNNGDVALEAYKEIDFRKADFFMFLDKELNKIETFYKTQEDHVNARLGELRQHLHRLRESRAREIAKSTALPEHYHLGSSSGGKVKSHDISSSISRLAQTVQKYLPGHVGETSRAMSRLGSPVLHAQPDPEPQRWDGARDYVRKHREEVSYRSAKKKLKLALQSYYRDLERLKTYSLLNRTAFRKINKKYSKKCGFSTQYMELIVNKAHFVTSEDLDHLLNDTEDLYSRYFERGNKKLAISKLRSDSQKRRDFSQATARTGALLAAGAVFAIQGLISGVEDIFHHPAGYDPVHTSYLLQIYAGYFMIVVLAFLFMGCAWWFNRQKINYAFIFELNGRHSRDWRELIEIPSWFWFVLGLVMYLNLTLKAGGTHMYTWWPVVLIGIASLMLFLPVPVFYYPQRMWLASTLGRVVTASTIILTEDVEFRDLFIGDILCSLTYSAGNVELFFCLYGHLWDDIGGCNSSNSWVLGLFSCLPGFWRLVQCLKRYWISGEWFPNIVNSGKYAATIMQYATLSMYRINKESTPFFATFIAWASINTIYCSVWDIVMDWSLGDAQHHYLRRTLIYGKHKWMYYAAMAIDPLLRANWIFYAIYTRDVQHSTIVSFAVALSEACRRGMWVLFRVENEHALNVQSLKASRDLPLPYNLSYGMDEGRTPDSPPSPVTPTDPIPQLGDSIKTRDVEQAQSSPVQTFLRRVGNEMRSAHVRDYHRRTPRDEAFAQDDEDDDEEDSDDAD